MKHAVWKTGTVGVQTVAAALLLTGGAWAANGAEATTGVTPWLMWVLWGVTAPTGAVVGLLFAWRFYRYVKGRDPGDELMRKIAEYVRAGAYAYLKRQYAVVTVVFIVLSALLAWMAWGLKVQSKIVPFAFLTGGFFSGLCGYIGMKTATMASSRTTQAAKQSLNSALQVAFRAGAVMGLVVVGFGLLDICIWFAALYFLPEWFGMGAFSLEKITVTMLCFGMGASTQALFARVGGGIFTKAADVGADLVGKVEAGIPEDDPRNPATIADNVGDNVGDVAGMGADLYESYCGSILASAALGVAAAGVNAPDHHKLAFIVVPMAIAGIGVFISILGCYLVRTREDASQKTLLRALNRGIWGASGLILLLSLGVVWLFLSGPLGSGAAAVRMWGAIAAGLVAGLVIGQSTELYTSDSYRPTRSVAEKSLTGPATVIIDGWAVGMRSTGIPVLAVVAAILLAFGLAGGFRADGHSVSLGLFGVGIAAVGMLSTLGITLATDAYGPIADNAGGNAEMSGQKPEVRQRTDALDALGNTTAATGKGFAIGSAALTALALLAAYVVEVQVGVQREADAHVQTLARHDLAVGANLLYPFGEGKYVRPVKDEETGHYEAYILCSAAGSEAMQLSGPDGPVGVTVKRVKLADMGDWMTFYNVNLMNPRVICGLMLGGMLTFIFSSMTMRAVGRAAVRMVNEVRRQFREIPGIMEGSAEPDYASCVSISTAGAQREMIIPSLLAIAVPVATGLVLDVAGVLGLLGGALTTGFLMAISMANAGGAWDNAKKYIERGAHGGKGSDAHKAAVVGDTVGDPFKDTSGPSLNILIKLVSMVSVVMAGLTVKYGPFIGEWLAKLSAK